ESTSVTSSTPRWSRLSERISSGPTKCRPSSPSSTPSPASTLRASSAAASSSTSTPLRFDTSTEIIALPAALRARLLRVELVGLDDPLDELVADDVLVAEADEGDALDRAEDVLDLDQAGRLLAREVDLGDVAGDDDLRAEAEPRQEHLHLLRARVLRLVEDDEAVVQRPPAKECQRRDFDRPALEQVVRLVGIHHVVERVEHRAHVR